MNYTMHLRITSVAALVLALVAGLAGAAQSLGDKKRDSDTGKKDSDRITAKTEIGGRNLDQWIELIAQEKHKIKDRSQTELAIKTVVLYGPDLAIKAVPTLISELEKHTSTNKIDMSVRTNAPVALGLILSSAKDADKKQVEQATKVLNKMLKDDQAVVRLRAAQALTQIGTMAKEAIANLCALTKDFDTWETRHQAALALGTVAWEKGGTSSDQAVEALYGRLQDSAIKVRLAALQSLDNLGVARSQDKQKLGKYRRELERTAYEDVDPVARLRAHLMVLPLLDKTDKVAIKKHLDALAKILNSPELQARLELVNGLATVASVEGKAPQQALVDILYKALSDKSPAVRMATMAALDHLKLGTHDRVKYRNQLERVADSDDDPVCRIHANVLLFPLLLSPGEKKQRAVALGSLLSDPTSQVKVEAAQAIAHLGGEAKDAIPQLTIGLSDPDHMIVGWCIFALAHMEKEGMPALPYLQKIVANQGMDAEVRENAQDAINIITGKMKLPRDAGKKGADHK